MEIRIFEDQDGECLHPLGSKNNKSIVGLFASRKTLLIKEVEGRWIIVCHCVVNKPHQREIGVYLLYQGEEISLAQFKKNSQDALKDAGYELSAEESRDIFENNTVFKNIEERELESILL